MAEHAVLKKALRQMAEGSKSAFRSFYLGTSQYIYSSALLLYDSHEDACRFMVDFYQYLYLHLPEYTPSANLEHWISHLMMERYEQLSIGKDLPKPSVRQQMHSTTSPLSKSEQERIWRMLDVNIHFPKESVRRSPTRILLFASALLLLLLIVSRYAPAALKQLQAIHSAETSGDNSDKETGSADESTGEDAGSEKDAGTDESDSLEDTLNDLLEERANTATDSESDDSDDLQIQQSTDHSDSDQPQTPASPSEPDEPEQPEEPQTPASPDSSGSDSDSDNLDDLELQLHYGDSLLFTDSN